MIVLVVDLGGYIGYVWMVLGRTPGNYKGTFGWFEHEFC